MNSIWNRKLGWKPDRPDFRDKKYSSIVQPFNFPPKIDLSPQCPPVMEQGDLGSCVSNAIASLIQFDRRKQGLLPDFTPSRLFIYYECRVLDNSVASDAGAYIRDAIKVVSKIGVPDEALWPYHIRRFKTQPPEETYKEAAKYRALQYYRIDNTDLNSLKHCLYSGYPFAFGYSIYESGAVADDNGGVYPMPSSTDKDVGGHAVLCVGYDDEKKLFKFKNSWGSAVGDKGYFYIPYDYVMDTNLADDFWTIRTMT